MARVWLFGEDVDTDQMVPGRYAPYMTSEAELANYAFIEARPDFAKEIVKGDVIVAGKNFGCGSSREYAPLALKLAGVGAIVAPSFARIFFRNALNLGLPLFETECEGFQDGMIVDLDQEEFVLTERVSAGGTPRTWDLPKPSGFVRTAWEEGGLLEYFQKHGSLPEMQA